MFDLPPPGTEVEARGLRQVVSTQQLGSQTLYGLPGLQRAVKGGEADLFHPFEAVTPIRSELCPDHATTIRSCLVYQASFLNRHSGPIRCRLSSPVAFASNPANSSL